MVTGTFLVADLGEVVLETLYESSQPSENLLLSLQKYWDIYAGPDSCHKETPKQSR